MKTLLLFVMVISSISSSAQISWWMSDYEKAQKICKESHKLMVIDFYADWCEPCKRMDSQLWRNSEKKINSENFVAVKIDVMVDKNTPFRFNVKGIPKVVIAMADGTVIWDRTGFSSAEDFVSVLNSIPEDVSELYKCYNSINTKNKDSKCAFYMALEFQKLAKEISNRELQNKFIQRDIEYFKKSIKYDNAPEVTNDIELYLILNDVYKGNPQRALKKFNKKYNSASDCTNQDLAHFLLANCYKQINDEENFAKEIALIRNIELLAQLE